MTETTPPLSCQQCAKQKAIWTANCPHAAEMLKGVYDRALKERTRPRLTSDDVRRAISGLSFSWTNVYHLGADALNRILDEKEKTP